MKKASPEFVECMYQLITKIWTTETMTEDWNRSIICPIHKKGDVTMCSNYRGINLLRVAYKISSNILFNRLLPHVETTIGDYQCGYRGERSTVDQISPYARYLKNVVNMVRTHITSLLILKQHMTVQIDVAYMQL
jgi:hypothetical protein